MKITPNQVFLHGEDRYEPDTEYDVSEADGVYFVRNGWAASPELDEPGSTPVAADLDVHDAASGQEG